MILRFPDVETARLAITSGLVPEAIQTAAVKWTIDDDASLWVETTAPIPRGDLTELRELGVQSKRSNKLRMKKAICWHQIFPPSPEPLNEVGDKTEVLFEIESAEALPAIVGELLRLGNDRQGFRRVSSKNFSGVLLRVTSPPYYTLLRAIDNLSAEGQSVRAFVQKKPRVWVEAGCDHPFADRISPPAGQWLLLDSENTWRFLEEAPFRDVYEVLDFKLPAASNTLKETPLDARIEVPLQLVPGTARDLAELWVLEDDAVSQIEKLIRRSDDALIDQLTFAVATGSGSENSDQAIVIVRARPGRSGPPILVVDGVACRPYLKIPNLFLPIDSRLHPPLRRDAVHGILAAESESICWLLPTDNGSFLPQTIADSAFRPMSEWTEYVLDNHHQQMDAWIDSHRFDFESFVCSEDDKDDAPPRKSQRKKRGDSGGDSGNTSSSGLAPPSPAKRRPKTKDDTPKFTLAEISTEKAKPSALQAKLKSLEKRYTESVAALDAPERRDIWREMGITNARLGHRNDTTICWSNALWAEEDEGQASSDVTQWANCEASCAEIDEITGETLDKMIERGGSTARNTSMVAAALVHAAQTGGALTEAVASRQSELIQFMQAQENNLPIRAAWMAWQALYKVSGDDVLMLARARDRLLERLFHHGLSPEFDMATFLRSGGIGGDDFGEIRHQVRELEQSVLNWVIEPTTGVDPQTGAYASMMFAFAYARLGEATLANHNLKEQTQLLERDDELHAWVYRAYQFRIEQSLAGVSTRDALSDELIQLQAAMDSQFDRYKLDKLRQQSRILDPQGMINAYKRHHGASGELESQLESLVDLSDRDELRSSISQLLEGKRSSAQQVQILSKALEVAPRLDEEFASGLLRHAPSVIEICGDTVHKALVLQKAIFLAAHYGQIDSVQLFVQAFDESLEDLIGDYLTINVKKEPSNQEKIDTIETLFNESLRGMRKLGMREEIANLYGKVSGILESETAGSTGGPRSKEKRHGDPSRADRLRLCVAGGWYYFGEADAARKIADGVRKTLFSGQHEVFQQNNLACTYIRAIAQAGTDETLTRINELFELDKRGQRILPKIEDMSSTSSHYSINQLNVIEASILAIVGDDITMNAESRRMLDEDEFLIRSRIHRDVQQAMQG